MPEMDGVTAANAIRNLPDQQKAAVPIIAMTANTGKEDIMRCLDAGMNDYCAKPIDPNALSALLLRVTKTGDAFKAAPQRPAMENRPAIENRHVVRAERIVHTPEAATPAAPPREGLFDPEILGPLKGLGKEQFDELMKSFYDKTESLIDTAEQSVETKSLKALTACGHDLAGMTSNFGFTALGDVAKRINRLGRDNASVQALTPQVAQLRSLYIESRAAADAWIKQ
jgi:CheY-like chemotaxis protein